MGASNRYRYLQLGAYLSLANAQQVSYETSQQPGGDFVAISEAEAAGNTIVSGLDHLRTFYHLNAPGMR